MGLRTRVLLLASAALLAGSPALAQSRSSLEYQVKAAYLLNFTRYVDWPPQSSPVGNQPVYICVLGEDPFGANLDAAVRDKLSHGRQVAVRRITTVNAAQGCHIVFLSQDEWRGRRDTILALNARGVLTVGDTEEFARDGGVIGFVITNETVRFVVNLRARERAGVRISSRVLSLATALVEVDPH